MKRKINQRGAMLLFLICSFLFTTEGLQAQTSTLTGRILYNGLPITNYTNKLAKFLLVNFKTQQEVNISPQYNNTNGTFSISIPNMTTGSYLIYVNIDAAQPLDDYYSYPFPGDYKGSYGPIVLGEGSGNVSTDVTVKKIIHLTSLLIIFRKSNLFQCRT